ncbi:MAG: hypothetical protein F4X35_06155, partial [Alphaproteobacteria bacterium]|nr:hypothetical protein [Alphaproteobacteria bacterium]
DQAAVEPVYEQLEGWSESTAGATGWAQLPATAVKYVRRIEELIGCPVAMLSTGPDREDTIAMYDLAILQISEPTRQAGVSVGVV